MRVVWDERLRPRQPYPVAAQHLLDDGVASLRNFDGVGVVHNGAAVVPLARDFRPAPENVEARQNVRRRRKGRREGKRARHYP